MSFLTQLQSTIVKILTTRAHSTRSVISLAKRNISGQSQLLKKKREKRFHRHNRMFYFIKRNRSINKSKHYGRKKNIQSVS